MSETVTTEATTEGADAAAVDPHKPEPKLFDEAYVKSLRDEAAAARVAKKEAVDTAVNALKAAHAEELAAKDVAYTELQNEMASAQLELTKVRIALEARVPSEKVLQFAAILHGTDEDSLVESAKSSLELFGSFDTKSPAFDPSQGRGGKPPIALNGDPILEAIKNAVGIK